MSAALDKIVKAYIAIREARDRLRAEFKEQEEKLNEQLAVLEQTMRAELDKLGVESVRTEFGTAFVTYKDFVSVENWDAVLDFVLRNQAYHFLTRSVVKSAVKEFLETSGEVPPGVRYERIREVQVRKPKE